MKFLDEIISLIDESIKEDAQNIITAGNIIKDGFDISIDEYRNTISQSHIWLGEYQKKISGETNITNLRIKYTNNIGYFIEVGKNQGTKVPDFFIHKQSLLQVHRYTTQELLEFEEKLSLATQGVSEKEYDIFLNIRNSIVGYLNDIYGLSRKISFFDFCVNGAYISRYRNYATPKIHTKFNIEIEGGRHPVIERVQKDFITNDMLISKKDFIHVITGPNMGGKSTFLRQNALLILMAHIGYDIPCTSAEIGLTDKIFSRVGSGDNLYLGQSTFMVEMQEISYILRNSTKKSFVIIDEIGRGTSTYDGMSLAWSILKYNHDFIGAKTLFATHYHEIIDHASELHGVKNFSVAVGENYENIVFLRKIIPGGIKKSYGIEVAKLAGIPEIVLEQARSMMFQLQSEKQFQQLSLVSLNDIRRDSTVSKEVDNLLLQKISEIHKNIISFDINSMTPIRALQELQVLQEQIKNLE